MPELGDDSKIRKLFSNPKPPENITPFPARSPELAQSELTLDEVREYARDSGKKLMYSHALGDPFGIFHWVESRYDNQDERDLVVRDGLFQGAAEVLADVALGHERGQELPTDADTPLWGEEFEAQMSYLSLMYETRQNIPHRSYRKETPPLPPEAQRMTDIINAVKHEPASTRDAYLTQKAHELALAHLGITEEQIKITPEFKDWKSWERGHLKEIVDHTNKNSVHGRKDIQTSRDV